MTWFTHRFETAIARHAVGSMRYTVVLLDVALHDTLPLREHPRLRIEADVGGVPVKGAWQPARGLGTADSRDAAWSRALQRGLAHYIESAKRADTRAARLQQVEAALLGTAPMPWARTRTP